MSNTQATLFPEIEKTIRQLSPENITEGRKTILNSLGDYIQEKIGNQKEIRINFICTHNSRRSHLAQVWAQAMACYFGIKNVFCYSGGTESTALFAQVAVTLKNSGFDIHTIVETNNPIYGIKYGENEHPVIGFSKKFDDVFNPVSEFAAVMTCSQADGDCPFIVGAEKRIPITYEDPKTFDNTPEQTKKYMERSLQIATEMLYVFAQIKS